MVVLKGTVGESKAVPAIYLLAKQLPNAADQQAGDKPKYRVVEIEGALQFSENDDLNLSDLEFAGDGKTLLQVHDRGTQTLISQVMIFRVRLGYSAACSSSSWALTKIKRPTPRGKRGVGPFET